MSIAGPLIAAGANLAGGYLSSQAAKENAERNMYMQIAFARHGLKWKVADAKEAGIHPLYALGASTHSFSPVSVGDTSLGSGLAAAGQDIGRALMATRTPGEKADAFSSAAKALQLDGLKLDNDLKRARLASELRLVTQPGSPPGMPSEKGGEADVLSHDVQKPELTPYTLGGVNFPASRRFSNAQTLEDRFGEMASLLGPFIFMADAAERAGWSERSWKDNLLAHYVGLMRRYFPHAGRR